MSARHPLATTAAVEGSGTPVSGPFTAENEMAPL